MNVVLYFDAACSNNGSKVMGIGCLMTVKEIPEVEFTSTRNFGIGTNNIAEWMGCVVAFRMAFGLVMAHRKFANSFDAPLHSITVYSDSQLIVRQYIGMYKIKHKNFIQYRMECVAIADRIFNLTGIDLDLEWVPREENNKADGLSRVGLQEPVEKWQKIYT